MISLPAHPDDEPNLCAGLPPDYVVRAFVTYPGEMESFLAFIRPEHFRALEQQYLIAELLRFRDRDGLVPTEKSFRAFLVRDLSIDDSDVNGGYENVLKLLEPLPARDLPNIRRTITEWAKKQAIRRIVKDRAAIEAIARGDSGPLRELLDEADAIGQEAKPSRILHYADLLKLDRSKRWIVDKILAADQPMMIGGPPKVLKTLISIDLAVSIATGTKFLDRYQAIQQRVLYYSAESDGLVVCDHLTAILNARRISHEQLGTNFGVHDQPPCASRAEELVRLKNEIAEQQAKVVFIDPLYMGLLSTTSKVASSDIHGMGSLMGALKRVCTEAGATLVLVHHFNRKGERHGWGELDDLSQAGGPEFAGQWILIRRATEYTHDGIHELNIVAGGRANSRGERFQIDIKNVIETAQGDVARWDILDFRNHADIRQVEQAATQRRQGSEENDLLKALERLAAEGGPISRNALRTELNWNSKRIKQITDLLVGRGIIECHIDKIKGRSYECVRLPAANGRGA